MPRNIHIEATTAFDGILAAVRDYSSHNPMVLNYLHATGGGDPVGDNRLRYYAQEAFGIYQALYGVATSPIFLASQEQRETELARVVELYDMLTRLQSVLTEPETTDDDVEELLRNTHIHGDQDFHLMTPAEFQAYVTNRLDFAEERILNSREAYVREMNEREAQDHVPELELGAPAANTAAASAAAAQHDSSSAVTNTAASLFAPTSAAAAPIAQPGSSSAATTATTMTNNSLSSDVSSVATDATEQRGPSSSSALPGGSDELPPTADEAPDDQFPLGPESEDDDEQRQDPGDAPRTLF